MVLMNAGGVGSGISTVVVTMSMIIVTMSMVVVITDYDDDDQV